MGLSRFNTHLNMLLGYCYCVFWSKFLLPTYPNKTFVESIRSMIGGVFYALHHLTTQHVYGNLETYDIKLLSPTPYLPCSLR